MIAITEKTTAEPAVQEVLATELQHLRAEIERVDDTLVRLLAERVELARRIGGAKRNLGLPLMDPAREAAVVRRAGSLAREVGIDGEEVRCVFWRLIGLARREQAGAQ